MVSATAPGIPRQVLGRWTRTVTAAEVARTQNFRDPADGIPLPAGTWRVQIGADGVARYTSPAPDRDLTVGQVRFEPGGRLVVGNQIPDFSHASPGGFCGDAVGDGIYHWSLHGKTLTVQVVSDHQCANRNSFWNGTFTRSDPRSHLPLMPLRVHNTGGDHETSNPRPSATGLARARQARCAQRNTSRAQRPSWSWTWRLVLAFLVMALAAACSSAAGHAGLTTQTAGHPAAASALNSQRIAYGSVVLDGSPGTPVADTRTGTLYVPIQCTTSFCGPDKPAHVMDVINAATCNAKVRSGCQVVARATVGNSPTAAVVDDETGTVYVTNSNDGTVSVVNEARCNARVTSGCDVPRATIKLGGFLVAAAVNPVTRTLYVADLKGGVFVVDAAACNAVSTRGCAQAAREVKDSQGPAALDIDLATNTVYAVNNGDSDNGDTVSVIDGASCNGTDGSGCGQAPPTTKVGSGAFWAAVDQAHRTVYVTNDNDGTVSVINGARCNARVTSGCGSTWPTVTAGANPESAALDPSSGRSSRSIMSTTRCRSSTPGRATAPPPRLRGPGPERAGHPEPEPRVQLVPRTSSRWPRPPARRTW